MRKQVTAQVDGKDQELAGEGKWLDLDQLARVEVSSETAAHPIEAALVPGGHGGWQADATGPATITLRFDAPQDVGQMMLHVVEPTHERSQEWALAAVLADGSQRELLRQGWNFSPDGSNTQREIYRFNLKHVVTLTLTIDPDRGRDRYPATLLAWRVGAQS